MTLGKNSSKYLGGWETYISVPGVSSYHCAGQRVHYARVRTDRLMMLAAVSAKPTSRWQELMTWTTSIDSGSASLNCWEEAPPATLGEWGRGVEIQRGDEGFMCLTSTVWRVVGRLWRGRDGQMQRDGAYLIRHIKDRVHHESVRSRSRLHIPYNFTPLRGACRDSFSAKILRVEGAWVDFGGLGSGKKRSPL